jgi:DNA invertase Pin-like site-specific DNA recombinase
MSPRTLPRQTTLRAVTAEPLRAGIYGRASSDPKKRGRSIKDQFAVAELDCQENGWTIHGYYEDRDRSASRRATKVREDYERLVADAESGVINVIVYAERSRVSRNLGTSLALRDLCERTGVLLCYDGRVYDMRKPADRKEFTRDSVQSEEEAETIIARGERTARLNAQRGAPHGKIPFGYTRRYDPDDGHLIGQVPHPRHSEVVVDLFKRAAAQESLTSLQERLREYVPDATRAGLRYLLSNRTYLGVRTYKGEDMSECQWPAILNEVLFDEVQEVLKDPVRRTQRDSRVRHLLSGLAVCAECHAAGMGLEGGLRAGFRQGAWRYRCQSGGHVQVRLDTLDAFVEAALFRWLSSKAAVAVFRRRQDGDEVERLKLKVRNMKIQLAAAREKAGQFDENGLPLLTIESLASTERQLLPMIAEDEERLRVLTAADDPLLARLVGAPEDEIAGHWNEELSVAQRRHVIRHTVNIRLGKASRQGVRRLEPSRVVLTFAGQPGFAAQPRRGLTVTA